MPAGASVQTGLKGMFVYYYNLTDCRVVFYIGSTTKFQVSDKPPETCKESEEPVREENPGVEVLVVYGNPRALEILKDGSGLSALDKKMQKYFLREMKKPLSVWERRRFENDLQKLLGPYGMRKKGIAGPSRLPGG